jgi:RNA polymerase sigma-70 factor (sigma-E family)
MVAGDDGWGELAVLYREHAHSLVRLALLLVDDIGTAEEIVQDAFVLVHRQSDRVRRPAAYLRTTVVNLSRSRLRRRLVALRHPAVAERHSLPADDGVGFDDDQRAVIAALQRLPRRQREVLVLRYWSELSEDEIAGALSISKGSVKTHAHRGMVALQRELEA